MKKTILSLIAAALMTGSLLTVSQDASAATVVYFSISDGRYYDHQFNRLRPNWHPPKHAVVKRVKNIHHYRRAHKLPPHRINHRARTHHNDIPPHLAPKSRIYQGQHPRIHH